MEQASERKYHSLRILIQKELSDFIDSKRLWLFLIFMCLMIISSLYGALSGIKDAIDEDSSFVFLKLFTTSANSIPSYNSLMALLGPFIGIFMGFDAINSERTEGTLNRLVSQPIYRDGIIIGKFVAGLEIIAAMVFSSGLLIGAAGIIKTGLRPSGEEIGRLLIYLLFTVVYIGFWLALAQLFSTICRHAATSALACIAVWLLCAIFISLLAGIIADGLYPTDGYNAAVNQLSNYNCSEAINRLSPYYLFGEAASTILNPSVRTINAVTVSQLVGALSGNLSLGQSVLLVWPHLTALFALMLILFMISYISFMRQEIRAH